MHSSALRIQYEIELKLICFPLTCSIIKASQCKVSLYSHFVPRFIFFLVYLKKSLQPVKPKPELTDPQSAKAIMKQSSIKKTNKKAESKKESERDRDRLKKGN